MGHAIKMLSLLGVPTSNTGIIEKARLLHRYHYWARSKCIFIHIPKAAGTSINHALYGRTLGHYSIKTISDKFPGLVRDSFVFSFARNPFSRILSSYHFAKAGKTVEMGMSHPEKYKIPTFDSFERFLYEWLVNQDLAKVDYVFQPQHGFVCHQGKLAVDFLGHVESLDEDTRVVEETLGRPLKIQRKNALPPSNSSDWEKVLSKDMRATIVNLYQKDFALLGYQQFLH